MQSLLSLRADYRALAAVIWAAACVAALLAFLPVTAAGGRMERVFDALACPTLIYIGYRMYNEGEGDRPSLYQSIVWPAALIVFLYGFVAAL